MSYAQPKTQPRPIAEIVREKTNDGELIVDFLVDMVLGKIEGASLWHRLEATRQLQRLGLELPIAVKQAVSTPANGHKPERAPGNSQPVDELADIIREKTGGGKDIVQFLIDAMQGKLEGFKPRHRLAASDRLITRGFDNAPGHTVVACEHDDPYNAEDAPFDFESYTIDDYTRDRDGERALFHIFGGEEARKAASKAYTAYRHAVLDYDHSPIENPADDPFGKGCYGYNVLTFNYGDNDGIRIANRAALEFNRRRYKRLLNEDGSLSALADTSSLDPKALQYLERNRHLLAKKLQPPEPPAGPDSKPGPDSEHPQEPPVGEGLRPSRDPQHVTPEPPPVILSEAEGSPTSAPPSSSAAPDQPQNTRVGEDSKPVRGYGHCKDCSSSVGEGLKPSRDPDKPPAEHDSERPSDTPVGEGFKPSRDPEGPPAPTPPPQKKTPQYPPRPNHRIPAGRPPAPTRRPRRNPSPAQRPGVNLSRSP